MFPDAIGTVFYDNDPDPAARVTPQPLDDALADGEAAATGPRGWERYGDPRLAGPSEDSGVDALGALAAVEVGGGFDRALAWLGRDLAEPRLTCNERAAIEAARLAQAESLPRDGTPDRRTVPGGTGGRRHKRLI